MLYDSLVGKKMTVHFVEDLDSSNVLISMQTFSATFTETVHREEFTQNYVFKTLISIIV